MIAAIHQPNFLPWIGYFQKIKNSDVFVFLDDVQFERGKTFTSRTKIIIGEQEAWLTLPIKEKSELKEIRHSLVNLEINWKKKHLRTLELNYRRAPFFQEVFELIRNCYSQESEFLIDFNISLILAICDYLGIETNFEQSSKIEGTAEMKGWDKILYILRSLNADVYLSGSGAGSKRYINEDDLIKENIQLKYQTASVKPYRKNCGHISFEKLSIVDLLFHKGKDSVLFF